MDVPCIDIRSLFQFPVRKLDGLVIVCEGYRFVSGPNTDGLYGNAWCVCSILLQDRGESSFVAVNTEAT